MDLIEKYRSAEDAENATVAKIRKACAAFMAATPDFYPTPENEATMFRTMQEHDELRPTSVAGWSECFALCRDDLKERPATHRQRSAPALTEAEINSWSAVRMQKEIESSPRREREIETALSRR